MEFTRGMRDKLSKYVDINREFDVILGIEGDAVYDYSCFGVDANEKLSDDRYMIFYNQIVSPNNEISFSEQNGKAVFKLKPNMLPQSIEKLVFTVSIDGNGTMGEIKSHNVAVIQNGIEKINMSFSGSDFKSEKAIISIQIYRKEEWRISAVANGFNGGLSALLASFGGIEDTTVPSQPVRSVPVSTTTTVENTVPAPPKISLKKTEKQLAQEVMGKISLAKDREKLEKHVVSLSKCVVSLSKNLRIDLGATRAKVVVVLDYSGSMSSLYRYGTVQSTLDRLVPLGLTFDDNGEIDVFLFETRFRRFQAMNLSNYSDYVTNIINRSGYSMGGTNYAPVLSAILDGYTEKQGGMLSLGSRTNFVPPIVDNGDPTFILFITDGDNADKTNTDRIIKKASEMNVFIQFIGIGSGRFDYLMGLDDLQGRKRDNTGFSSMLDLAQASDDELYANILTQFSAWLNDMQ